MATNVADRLGPHLEETYGIDVSAVRPIEGGALYRVVRNDGDDWVARPFPPERPVERARGDADVLRFLESAGYPAERCAHAEPVSRLGRRAVLVTAFVADPPPGLAGRSRIPLWVFAELGDLLGRLHATEVPKEIRRDGGSWHGDPRFEGLPARDVAAARAWLAEVGDRVSDAGRGPFDELHDDVDGADTLEDLPRSLVHPDFVPVNALAASNGRVTVVDWTGTGLGPRLASLANLLWSAAGDHEGTLDERIDAIVSRYRRHLWLEDDELARLAKAMWIRPLLFGCWYYRASITSGYTPTGREPWWPDRKAVNRVSRSARAAFRAESLPRTGTVTEDGRPKPEIPGQLSFDAGA